MGTQHINRILNLVVMMALVLSWLPTTSVTATSAPGAQAAPSAPAAQMLPVESLLNPDGTLNIGTDASGTLDLRGWNVTLDSARGPILTHDAPAPAAPNAEPWSALANGLNGPVRALAVMGSDLYVGGIFTQTADGTVTNLNYIARYSGGTWLPLAHHGLSGQVWALAVIGSDLYVGGWFTQTADSAVTNLNHIAKYSGGGAWSALAHHGLNSEVDALAVIGSDLYVGGDFTATADGTVTNLNGIAKYSGGGTWSALAHNGLLISWVHALAVNGSDLYVGGWFTQSADGTVKNLNNIAKYNGGGTWSALANNGLNEWVDALAVIGSDLYVGGTFTQTANGTVTNLNHIAKYSGGTWSALANNGLNGPVYALTVSGSDLYAGGYFSQSADAMVTHLNNIARYSGGGTWSALVNNGLNNTVLALAVSGSDLYVGGYFHQTFDGAVTHLGNIARLGASVTHSVYLPLVTK